jgi:hypothetical protein
MKSLKNEVNDKAFLKVLKSNMSDNDELSFSDPSNKNDETDDSIRSNSDASDKEYMPYNLSPKVQFSIDSELNNVIKTEEYNDIENFEYQNNNDECLSGITNESKYENEEKNTNFLKNNFLDIGLESVIESIKIKEEVLTETESEPEPEPEKKENTINVSISELIEPKNEELNIIL